MYLLMSRDMCLFVVAMKHSPTKKRQGTARQRSVTMPEVGVTSTLVHADVNTRASHDRAYSDSSESRALRRMYRCVCDLALAVCCEVLYIIVVIRRLELSEYRVNVTA